MPSKLADVLDVASELANPSAHKAVPADAPTVTFVHTDTLYPVASSTGFHEISNDEPVLFAIVILVGAERRVSIQIAVKDEIDTPLVTKRKARKSVLAAKSNWAADVKVFRSAIFDSAWEEWLVAKRASVPKTPALSSEYVSEMCET